MEMNLEKYREEVEFLKSLSEKQFKIFMEYFDLEIGEKYKMKVHQDGRYTLDTITTLPFMGGLEAEDFHFILYFPYQMDGGRGAPEFTNQFFGLKYYIEELENGNISYIEFKKIEK